MLFHFGDHALDLERRELHRGLVLVPVEPQVFDLLVHLMRNRDRVISKDELIETVWGGRIVSEATIDSRVKAARQAVGDSGMMQRIIRTSPRKGVRFVADVCEQTVLAESGHAPSGIETSPLPSRGKPSLAVLPFQNMSGDLTLKNIARPVEALVTGLNEGAVQPRPDVLPLPDRQVDLTQSQREPARVAGARGHSRPSIAVLPFIEHGAKAEDSLIGDGISEDAIAALASLPDLFVISRNSTLRYREYQPNIQTVGRELGVRYICSGTVRRSGNRLRVSAEVADVESGTVIATDRFEGDTSDLFALQDRLTERVLQTIAPHIRDAELRRIRNRRTDSLDAYEYMLRGLDLLYRLDFAGFEQARTMFERSISLDEDYAAPYAFTALWHSIRFQQGWSPDAAKDLKSADEFAAAALLRDQNDVWALSLSGHLRALLFRDFDAAFALFDRALRVSPNSAFAWARSSPAFNYIGETAEARRRAEEALRLSPFDPYIFFTHCTLAITAYIDCDYKTAVTWGRRSYAGHPTYTANLRFLAASLAANGQLEDARGVGESLRRLDPHFQVRNFLQSYAVQDEQVKARLSEHLLAAGLPP